MRQQLPLWYSGLLTALIIGIFVGQTRASVQVQRVEEIDVQRINVREPDGTLRMVIANRSRLPGVIVSGKEQPPVDRPQAGMLFYNDEGSENGGLIFGGRKNTKGEVTDSGGSLSFDQYGGNQIVQLIGVHDSTDHIVGLLISDTDTAGNRRVFVGQEKAWQRQGRADGQTRAPANPLSVASDGTPAPTFLDGEGKVLRRLVPE